MLVEEKLQNTVPTKSQGSAFTVPDHVVSGLGCTISCVAPSTSKARHAVCVTHDFCVCVRRHRNVLDLHARNMDVRSELQGCSGCPAAPVVCGLRTPNARSATPQSTFRARICR
ncbi:hypothetical protein ACJJTC_016993 [Scirpophaga incertulas]